ncbi:hypothetical protein [Streptomyces sp. NPDC055005]
MSNSHTSLGEAAIDQTAAARTVSGLPHEASPAIRPPAGTGTSMPGGRDGVRGGGRGGVRGVRAPASELLTLLDRQHQPEPDTVPGQETLF